MLYAAFALPRQVATPSILNAEEEGAASDVTPASTLGEPPAPAPAPPPVPVVLVVAEALVEVSAPAAPVVEDPVDPRVVVPDEVAPPLEPASFASEPQKALPNATPRTIPNPRKDGPLRTTPTSGIACTNE